MGTFSSSRILPRVRLDRVLPVALTIVTGTAAAIAVAASLPQEDKARSLRGGPGAEVPAQRFARPAASGQRGHQVVVGEGEARFPVVVVHGTPYEMGRQLGEIVAGQMRAFVPTALAGVSQAMGLTEDDLREVWARTAAYTDDRFEQELAGLADGSGLPLAQLQALHALPLLMPYSCSSIAAWGRATADGRLYQTRNLDWNLEVKAHEVPVIIVYLPDQGIPHVVPSFAGSIGAHTGFNARGVVLSEMGDASGKEMPYHVHAPHFTTWFRTLLYDAGSLTRALEIFQAQPQTKKYHFVFGDGRTDKHAVKIVTNSAEVPGRQVVIWKDNDPADEFAPNVLPDLVYNDEGRGAFPALKAMHGRIDGEKLVQVANTIPIKGDNVMNVVYDATAMRMWISYAKGDKEAYQRPYVFVDLKTLDADKDGKADIPVR
jgi:hypothetical protein